MDVRRAEQLKNGSDVVGAHTKIRIVKNKVAPPFRVAEFDMIYGEGVSREGTLLDLATQYDIIHKSGAWFSYMNDRIGQGRDNARQYLVSHPDVTDEVEKKVREILFSSTSSEMAAMPAPEGEMPEQDDDDLLEMLDLGDEEAGDEDADL
jgi:recombination protein RecA